MAVLVVVAAAKPAGPREGGFMQSPIAKRLRALEASRRQRKDDVSKRVSRTLGHTDQQIKMALKADALELVQVLKEVLEEIVVSPPDPDASDDDDE